MSQLRKRPKIMGCLLKALLHTTFFRKSFFYLLISAKASKYTQANGQVLQSCQKTACLELDYGATLQIRPQLNLWATPYLGLT